jgi:hypothetical protein
MRVDEPEAISDSLGRTLFGIKASGKYELLRVLRRYPHTHSAQPFGDSVHYTDRRANVDKAELVNHLKDEGLTSVSIEEIRPGIEDIFMDLMQGEHS